MTPFTELFLAINYGIGLAFAFLCAFDPRIFDLKYPPIRSKKDVFKRLGIFLGISILGIYGCFIIGILVFVCNGINKFTELPYDDKGE